MGDPLIPYRELIEQIPAATYFSPLNKIRTRTFTGPQIERLSGFSRQDWLIDPALWLNRVHPEDRKRVKAELEECRRSLGPFCSEYRFLDREGRPIWIHDEAVVVHSETKAPDLLQGLMRDITERKLAELAMQDTAAKLRGIFAAMTDVVLVLDGRGRYLEVAPTNPRLLYRPASNLLMRTLHEVFPFGQAETFLGYIQSALTRNQTVMAEYCLQVEGKELWFSAAISPMAENKVLWVARDITERKLVERALAASDEKFRSLILNSTDIITIHDGQGILKYATPSIQRVLGYCPEELIGRNAFELIHPDDLRKLGSEFRSVVERTNPGTWTEYRVRHANGNWHYLETMGTNLLEQPGVEGIVLTSRDVTEHKRIEAEIQRRVTELDAVNRITTVLRCEQTFQEMLEHFLDETLAVLGARDGLLWMYDAPQQVMREMVARGWCTQVENRPEYAGVKIIDTLLHSGEVMVSPHIRQDERLDPPTRELFPPGWAGAVVPIRTVREVIGLLFISVEVPRQFNQEEVHFLATLAEIAGTAIHRMRLFEQTENQLARLTVLRAIDTAISSNRDLRVAINLLLDQITVHLHLDAAAVFLMDKPHLELQFAAGRGFRSNAIARSHFRLGEGYPGRAALERRLLYIPDLNRPGIAYLREHLLKNEDFMSYYAAPLIADGEVLGVLEIFHRSRLESNPDWQDFFLNLCSQAAIAIEKASLFEELQSTNLELSLAYEATIEGWSMALDMRDKETEGHTQRVVEETLQLARAMGVKSEDLVQIRRGALLHDIGKMSVPDAILMKPGKLSAEETAVMRQHPQFAHQMLSQISYLQPALDIPYCHHEKWDGSGYPRGLKEEQIPLAARIFAVVDVYDALTSDRPYRKRLSEHQAIQYIRAQSGLHFDPRVVQFFLELHGQR